MKAKFLEFVLNCDSSTLCSCRGNLCEMGVEFLRWCVHNLAFLFALSTCSCAEFVKNFWKAVQSLKEFTSSSLSAD